MLLWLPVFTGSALAESVAMQVQHDCCPASGISQMDMDHAGMDMGDHQMQHDDMPTPGGDHGACGVCQLACSAYMAVPLVSTPVQTATREITPFLLAFDSVTFTPLLPPPLARA